MNYLTINETKKPFESLKIFILYPSLNTAQFIDNRFWGMVNYFDDKVIRIRISTIVLENYIFKINCNDWLKGEKYIEVP